MTELPEDIRRFIAANVTSVAQLELLLFLRDKRDRDWSADEVSQALYAAASGMTEQLNDLKAKGLLDVTHESDGRFRFRPRDDELDALIGRLATLYQERRLAVITLIYAAPTDKVRSFADAFRIRKEKES